MPALPFHAPPLLHLSRRSPPFPAVLTLLHSRLRLIGHRQLAREAEGHTLETDGLVNEPFLRLLGVERVQWRDREHLLATASRMMRRVLIDYADRHRAQKRGGRPRIWVQCGHP